MRALHFLILLCICTASKAGALEKCQQKEKLTDAVFSCVEAERVHSANQLRELSGVALKAVTEKAQQPGHGNLIREYRSMQARHVRERNTKCRKQTTPQEQKACEADMNNAQINQLARFTE